MNNSPRFRVGDRIQSGGAPDLVYQVREVKVNVYTLAPPKEALIYSSASVSDRGQT